MSVKKSLIWSYLSQITNFGLSFFGAVLLTRALSPYEFGVNSIAQGMAGIVSALTSFSISSYIIRETDLTETKLKSAFTINAIMSVVFSLILILMGVLAKFFGEHVEVAKILSLTAIGPLISIFDFLAISMMVREARFVELAVISVVKTSVSVVVSITLAQEGFGAISIAAGVIAGSACASAGNLVIGWQYSSLKVSVKYIKPITIFGLQMMSIGGLASVTQRISELIIGASLGLVELGLYSRASSLSTNIFENVYGLATRVLFSKMAADLRETNQLRETFITAIRFITAFMWPLILGLCVLSRPAVYLLYGRDWLGVALPLSILLIAQFIVIGFGMNWELFVLRAETGRQTKFEIVRALVGVVAITAGSMLNLAMATAGRIAEAIAGYVLYRPHMDRLAEVPPGRLDAVYIESLTLAAFAAGPSFALMVLNSWNYETPIWEIALAVVLGICLWLFALKWQDHPIWAQLIIVIGKFKSRD
ncbi:oligosaccharide flippase family protein [Methylobacterium pseudosasicola]|uniref:Membrane protein involved in the export of O-antigen and teichoic acid n=1 Tax=Methylobacterium pseudosasicola TaxID=582667 RepID=A0A1I4UGH0_9HYPH|nr:oligosaccharide flippase family protein [Methylobacterium pseudosasicola]SFM88104.1 Membrane protein involved in the export of O-antigen and teichoic acid [Methylobacterium pseudosasicola]